MISILLDFIPDSVHNEINLKHETVGKRSSTLNQIQMEIERIVQSETKKG